MSQSFHKSKWAEGKGQKVKDFSFASYLLPFALFCFFLSPFSLSAQERETDLGASFSLEMEKDLNRYFSLGVEEEVRLKDTNKGFDRNITALGVEYSFLNKRMKAGAYYAFIYLYNSNFLYEPRHRYYLNLSYKQPLGDFTLFWRGRLQGTYRDESRGEYKINPKYIMKNKVELEYAFWGKPWKPYLSCDFYTSLNDPVMGYELSRMRYQGGVNWRLNRTDYLGFFLRYDHYLSADDSHTVSVGVTYKMKWL
ncbi:MAG: DUF2490 domain-containing protein [Tannerella sp.]|jgi:hypothetical protein|nr:DUF2490 domain-containing protein [Tannerella sp.]